MNPYVDLAAELSVQLVIIECMADFGSIHDVPEEALQRMRARWETLDD